MYIKIARIIIPMVVVAIGIFYYFLPPQNYAWVPKCPWWLMTGTYCPSCGIQRFIHTLLNGRILDAFCMNPFLIISIPYGVMAVLGKWYNINGVFDKLNRVIYSRKVLISYVVLFFAWWAIRIIFKV